MRYSSSTAFAAALLLLGAAGCEDELPALEGTTSLRVQLLAPTELGSADAPLDHSTNQATVWVTALDTMGLTDSSVNGSLDVYVFFLGGLTPEPKYGWPLQRVDIVNGETGHFTVDLPPAFGPTYVWVEHTGGDEPTYATGTSPRLWYRDAFLEDVSRPYDEDALDATSASPLEHKQINVTGSRYGEAGRIMVTGIYSQGFTISDSQCQDALGTPPCVTGDYDHLYIYSYGRPENVDGRLLEVGNVITGITGGVSEFNGLTEVSFPGVFSTDPAAYPPMVPEPFLIDEDMLNRPIEMERMESSLVAIEGAEFCDLDEEWLQYQQWKLDLGGGCDDSINVVTGNQVPDFDPANLTPGITIPRVVGTLRPINIGSFNVWLVYPRSMDDIKLPSP